MQQTQRKPLKYKVLQMRIVLCELPKAGLGNQMFPMMKACVFANINKLALKIVGYDRISIGPYLRREKSKRAYGGTFTFQKNIFAAQWEKWQIVKYRKNLINREPELRNIEQEGNADVTYLFSQIAHWSDYFSGLKENRELVISLLKNLILPAVHQEVQQKIAPCIGVHIRMGDFRALKENELFKNVGCVRTPENYFIDIINAIRKIHGTNLPVSIFSDGFKRDLASVLELGNIEMIEGNSAIVDILLLSRSKIIITSASSTFSYWSAFLSSAAVIMHPDHIHAPLRPEVLNNKFYEGPFDAENALLIGNIKSIIPCQST